MKAYSSKKSYPLRGSKVKEKENGKFNISPPSADYNGWGLVNEILTAGLERVSKMEMD